MKDKRQGNDLKVAWSIFKQDREPFRLEGLNVSLYLKSMFGRKPLNDFVITGNIIQWTFYGKDQKSSGKYSLEMVVNEGEKGMITTDACDFVNLVPCTCKIKNNEDELGVEIESIELESRVDLSSGEAVTIVIDSALSETSVNPVENRVITAEFNKKANKTEIPTKLSQLEKDIEISGESYDDSELRVAIAELERTKVEASDIKDALQPYATKEEIGNTYLPREEFEERIEGYATYDSVQELSENTDSKLTELSQQIKEVSERVETLEQGGQGGGTSSDKQGVIRQTQKWTQAADNGYDYVMQDVVRGAIPSYFIDLWKSRGGKTAYYNEESGYFELYNLKDISYAEALEIYARGVIKLDAYLFANSKGTRALMPPVNSGGANGNNSLNTCFVRCSTLESICLQDLSDNDLLVNNVATAFFGSSQLKYIEGVLWAKNLSSIGNDVFGNALSLEYVQIKGLKGSASISSSARLSNASILYMIQNEAATSAITITLHADAYERAMADAAIQEALTAHPNVSLAK